MSNTLAIEYSKTLPALVEARAKIVQLERELAEAVTKERERCAKVCEKQTQGKSMWIEGARACAAAIRTGE